MPRATLALPPLADLTRVARSNVAPNDGHLSPCRAKGVDPETAVGKRGERQEEGAEVAAKGGADAVEEADEGTKGEQWQVRGVGVGRRLRRESGGATGGPRREVGGASVRMRVLIIVAAAPASLEADISVRRLADRATAAVALHLSDEALAR